MVEFDRCLQGKSCFHCVFSVGRKLETIPPRPDKKSLASMRKKNPEVIIGLSIKIVRPFSKFSGDQDPQEKLDLRGETQGSISNKEKWNCALDGGNSFIRTSCRLHANRRGRIILYDDNGLPTEYKQSYGESGRHILVFMAHPAKAIYLSLQWD